MKLLLVLAACVALSASSAIPAILGDNSNYVDLHEPVDEALLQTKNGANNAYWLYTRDNPNTPQVIVNGNVNSIRASNYDGSRSLKVIVHGWNNNGNSAMNPLITSAYLFSQDCNVIVVDWNAVANSNYATAAAGVSSVGRFLGNFLEWLINNAGGNLNNVDLVGFNLGAHVVGNAGRALGGRVARIVGLDPSGPLFEGNSDALNRLDAEYVEVIHTDGGDQGTFNPIADADIYPNGGQNPQPGCWDSPCSHQRANQLFASTIRNNHLIARRCLNLVEARLSTCNGANLSVGTANLHKRGSGLFGLRTLTDWPF